MNREYNRYGGVSKMYTCPVCKSKFMVPFQTRGGGRNKWVYISYKARKKIYFCSYHCKNEAEHIAKGEV